MRLDLISFVDSDFPSPNLESTAEKIASFLYKYNSMMKHFVNLMRVVGNVNYSNYNQELQRFFSRLPKSTAADRIEFEKLMYEFKKSCSNDDEIRKMRGLITEKYFKIIFNQRHVGKKCSKGYGSIVVLDKEKIIYDPDNPFEDRDDCDKTRRTVDAGFWDGRFGEFVEIKLNPEAFRTLDINYLRLLCEKLDKHNVDYTIYLVAFGDKDLIEKRLMRLKLITEESNEFKLLGLSELQKFFTAC